MKAIDIKPGQRIFRWGQWWRVVSCACTPTRAGYLHLVPERAGLAPHGTIVHPQEEIQTEEAADFAAPPVCQGELFLA